MRLSRVKSLLRTGQSFYLSNKSHFCSPIQANNPILTSIACYTQDHTIINKGLMSSSVIVIGGGLAGLSAAIEAHRAGAKVTILDKTKSFGGNSAKATSGINGALTDYQVAQKIDDKVEYFKQDTLSSGDGLSDPNLVEILTGHSKEAIDWLLSFGMNLGAISQCGGHNKPRTHREPPTEDGKTLPVGWDIIKALSTHTKSFSPDTFVSIFEATANKLLIENGRVVGVEYLDAAGQAHEIRAQSTVLCTGGFCCDKTKDSLIKEFNPRLMNLSTTNGAFAIGEGVKMGRSIGAELVHMDKIQIHPTGFVDPKDPLNPVKFLGPEALRGCGGILINQHGKRFVDELGRRDHVSHKIFEQFEKGIESDPPAFAKIVLNEKAVENFGKATWNFYANVKGFGTKVEGTSGLAKYFNVDEEVIKYTLNQYRDAASGKIQDPFGKKYFPVNFEDTDNFYIATITPVLHYSMGGLKFNEKAQILRKEGETYAPIPGLYGAGEVTGGLHGENRLAGNSLLECVVFGRIAGKEAAKL